MINSMVNFVNNALQPLVPQQIQAASKPAVAENPFAAATFINVQNKRNSFSGKNSPVQGGYFAGYLNGQANIVGRKLFINA